MIAGMICFIILNMGSVFAKEGSHNVGRPDPVLLQIHEARSWSSVSVWDLRERDSIPSGALIRFIELEWDIMPAQGWGGVQFMLQSETKEETVFISGSSQEPIYDFAGEPVSQLWSLQFRVLHWSYKGQPLFAAPQNFTLYWQIPEDR